MSYEVHTGPCPACGGEGWDGTSEVRNMEFVLACGHRIFVRLNAHAFGMPNVTVVSHYRLNE